MNVDDAFDNDEELMNMTENGEDVGMNKTTPDESEFERMIREGEVDPEELRGSNRDESDAMDLQIGGDALEEFADDDDENENEMHDADGSNDNGAVEEGATDDVDDMKEAKRRKYDD